MSEDDKDMLIAGIVLVIGTIIAYCGIMYILCN